MSVDLSFVRGELEAARGALEEFLGDEAALGRVVELAEVIAGALRSGGKVVSAGNGGSLCDAMHFAEELSGRYREDRPAYAAVSISDASHLTCVGNDYGFERVFSRWVEAHGRSGDVLLLFSTSGRSANVLHAAAAGRSRGMVVAALTGKRGSALGEVVDLEVCSGGGPYADRAQELHIKVVHILIALVERLLSEE